MCAISILDVYNAQRSPAVSGAQKNQKTRVLWTELLKKNPHGHQHHQTPQHEQGGCCLG